MLHFPATKESLSALFEYMTHLYDERRFPDLEAVFQFVLEEHGETYQFYVAITDRRAWYGEGKHKCPSITIYAPVSIWFDIVTGKLNGFWGWVTRKYRVEGPISYLIRLKKVFGKKLSDEEIAGAGDRVHDYELSNKRVWKKPDHVLVFHGSPRRKNGATYFYLQALLKGIEQSGTQVELIDVYDKKLHIEPCRGCFACWRRSEGQCIIKDDVSSLLDKFNNAYLTIFALPLYMDSRPSRLQALIERMLLCFPPVFVTCNKLSRHPLRDSNERYMALFAVNGLPESEHLRPLIETFEANARNLHRPLIATIIRPGAEFLVRVPQYRESLRRILSALEEAGRELIEQGNVSRKLLNLISDRCGIDRDEWCNYANLFWLMETKKERKDVKSSI